MHAATHRALADGAQEAVVTRGVQGRVQVVVRAHLAMQRALARGGAQVHPRARPASRRQDVGLRVAVELNLQTWACGQGRANV